MTIYDQSPRSDPDVSISAHPAPIVQPPPDAASTNAQRECGLETRRRRHRICQSCAPTLSITTFQAPPLLASPPPQHSSRLIYLEDGRHCTPSAYAARSLSVFAIAAAPVAVYITALAHEAR